MGELSGVNSTQEHGAAVNNSIYILELTMSYQILAYSLSLNQTQQQIDLVGKPITEAQLAPVSYTHLTLPTNREV